MGNLEINLSNPKDLTTFRIGNQHILQMKNSNNKEDSLTKEFIYNAAIDDVWKALTNVDKMRIWYFPQLLEFEPFAGYEFQFYDNRSEYQKKWIVTQVIEKKTLAHSWAYKGYPGTSEVTFDICAEENNTTLIVTQAGLESFPKDPHFAKERFENGWDTLLGQNLKHLLEIG